MGCFDDFILFRASCEGDKESTSGLYAEDLPGLSVQNVADIAGDKWKNYNDFLARKVEFAARLTIETALGLIPNLRFNPVTRRHSFGCLTKTYLPFTPFERGVLLKRKDHAATFTFIERVSVLSNTTEDKNIKVTTYEGATNYPISLIAGEIISVDINQRVNPIAAKITMDNTDVSVSNSNISISGHDEDCEICDSCCDDFFVSGWDGVKETSKSYGLKVEASVRCDKELFFCAIKDFFKFAILYKTGAEIVKEIGVGDRLNWLTLYGTNELMTLKSEWGAAWKEHLKVEIDSLENYLKSINCPCFDCIATQLVTILP